MNIKTALDNQLAIGKEIYIANAENLEKFTYLKNISEYDIIVSAITGDLNLYTEKIIKTLEILENKLKIMNIFPEERAEEIKKELLNIIQNEEYLKTEKVEEILKKLQEDMLNIPNKIITKNDDDLQISKIVVKDSVKKQEFLFFIKILTEDNNIIWEIPVIASKNDIKMGVELLNHLTTIFSRDMFFVESMDETYEKEIIAIEGKLITYIKSLIGSIKKRITNYNALTSIGLKNDKLFKDLKISISKPIIIDYLPEEEFSIAKILPLNIAEMLKDSIIPPENFELHALNRNFLPLEELVKVEKLAMNIIMKLEEKRLATKYGYETKGKIWDVLDVSLKEHYDIKVVENGEEKYIEVKGHKGFLPIAELTEAEYKFAIENRDKYYLYIVCNIGEDGKNATIFEIHNPLDNEDRKVYLIRDGKKIDISKHYKNINIVERKRYLLKLEQK